jgi:hypothetical protein
MATKKISELTAKSSSLSRNDLIEISTDIDGTLVSRSVTGAEIALLTNGNDVGFKLLSGGIAWSGTGMTFNQSELVYALNGQVFSISQSTFVVSNGDATHGRFDVRVLDDTGATTTKEGTPSATPVVPKPDENEIVIGTIFVPATTTTFVGVIGQDKIYDENIEAWTISSAGSFDADSTDAPKVGTKCLEVTAGNDLIRFENATPIVTGDYATLSFWVRANINERRSGQLTFVDTVNGQLFNWGFLLRLDILNDWQLVTINLSNIPLVQFDAINFMMDKVVAVPTVDWFIDYFILNEGETQPSNGILELREDGEFKASINSINFVGAKVSENGTVDTVQSESSTSTVVDFTTFKTFGTVASPLTGNLTNSLTGAKLNLIQKIYHDSGTAPTVPAGWVLLGTTDYATSELNIIYAEFVGGTRVEYWITQEN